MGITKIFLLFYALTLTHDLISSQNTPVPYGQLKIQGRYVTDSQGNIVQLRGMAFFAADYIPTFFNETPIYQVKYSWNSNIVRLPQEPSTSCCGGWQSSKDRDFTRLKTAIDACIKHGLYAIIDWHAFQDPQLELALDFFANMSGTFGKYPNIIYELWNEPDGDNVTWAYVKSIAEQLIDVIRKNDPNNIIIVGTPNWSQQVDSAAADPINRTNIAYTLHYYAATHHQELRDLAQMAISQGLPIFITEYGTVQATGGPPIDLNQTYEWWRFNDFNKLSYVNWAIYPHDLEGSGANAVLKPVQVYQIGNPAYFSPSGKLVYKKHLSTDQGVGIGTYNRLDCHPDPGANADTCAARGCVFDHYIGLVDPELNIPVCYFPQNTGYISEVPVNSSDTISLKKSSIGAKNPYGDDFDELVFQSYQIGSGLRITIVPKNGTRYRPLVPINASSQILSSDKLNLVKKNDSIFSFVVQRQSSSEKIWDTSIGGLLFADKFIQIATLLPTDKIYGFGEHVHTSIKQNTSAYFTWGMWAKDNGQIGLNKNLYGVHPFYLGLEDDGNAHGVFIFNSNAQEVVLGPAPHLTYRTIGGQIEIFFFPGPTPEQVIQQYQQVIGTPFMPSYWALGFHICRWGYGSTADVQVVVNRTLAAGIPFDTAWADINYMLRYKDFTLDPVNWGDFGNYTNYLHQQGMHVILITDPGIEVDYDPFQRGREQNASFIEWPRFDMVPQIIQNQYPLTNGTKIMLGGCWPDKHVAFPDFLDPTGKTNEWWSNEFSIFRKTVALDGVWIDMNEPSVFGTGVYNTTLKVWHRKAPSNESLKCPGSGPDAQYDFPPYWTYSAYTNGPYLATDSLCLVGVSARGSQQFYDTKNLYGWSEMVATAYAQKKAIGKRGAVISRSTFPSSGVYGGHWLGDNHATWDDLKYSIIGLQEFNMFGIPFVGADICGFHGDTTEELCTRWQQLGAFYPFMRNHNEQGAAPQDPGVWPIVAEATKKANTFRYRHLPYLYSLLFSASLKGGTVARPVFFEFPYDNATYELSMQFMWGSAIIVIPVTDQLMGTINGYLPVDSTWYSLYDYFYGTQVNSSYGAFPSPQEYLIPVFVRGGYIVPRQAPAVTTTLARTNPFQLLVALATNSLTNTTFAQGELYWDDGETVIENINSYNYYHFTYNFLAQQQSATLNITMDKKATTLTLPTLDNIEILGYPYTPNLKSAKLNGQPITINTAMSGYSPFTKILNITTTNFIDLNNNGPIWQLTWNNS